MLTTPDGRGVSEDEAGLLVPGPSWGVGLVLSTTSFEPDAGRYSRATSGDSGKASFQTGS